MTWPIPPANRLCRVVSARTLAAQFFCAGYLVFRDCQSSDAHKVPIKQNSKIQGCAGASSGRWTAAPVPLLDVGIRRVRGGVNAGSYFRYRPGDPPVRPPPLRVRVKGKSDLPDGPIFRRPKKIAVAKSRHHKKKFWGGVVPASPLAIVRNGL